MKHYKVKEIFYTLQGEGAQSGRPSVFLRFSGCNLWNGLETHRDGAMCSFCDTDFVGTDGTLGGTYSGPELVHVVKNLFPNSSGTPFVVCTGGEPALQLDESLIKLLHDAHFEIAIETNGTIPLASGIDWICVSPKANAELVILEGSELKLVYPQKENAPENFNHLDFQHFFLQPLFDQNLELHTKMAIDYCLAHPQWKLSIQSHKIVGIP